MPFVLYYLKKGYRFEKSGIAKIKKRSILKRLFFDFPMMWWYDTFTYEPGTFKEQGVVIFTGRQGRGKSIAMTHYLLELKKKYPDSKLMSNYELVGEDMKLYHWQQLIAFKNGAKGVIVGIDEMQNWFSSAQSKNFPPEMLSVITQNRKNRRLICGTAQQFYMLAKNIRTQCTEVRKCRTFFNCVTFVKRVVLEISNEGEVKDEINAGFYFFVHSPELRASYDTYKCIEALSASGFNPPVSSGRDDDHE